MYARKSYGYDVRSFLSHTFLPCILTVSIIAIVLMVFIKLMSPSVVRFIVVSFTAELLIMVLGYLIVLERNEKKKVLTYIQNITASLQKRWSRGA